VKNLHDLHIWSVTSGLNALSCNVVVDEKLSVADTSKLLAKIEHDLLHCNIQHTTLQIEGEGHLHDDSLYCAVKPKAGGHHHHHH